MASVAKITPCLWFDGQAEAAANFYVTLFDDSRVDRVMRSPTETPSGAKDSVLTVEFTLAGQSFLALNGGPQHKFNEAVSFVAYCDDQAQTDHLWDALCADGGQPIACGWLKDRFGLSWQITPRRLWELMVDEDRQRAARAMQAMMKMVKIDIAALDRAVDA